MLCLPLPTLVTLGLVAAISASLVLACRTHVLRSAPRAVTGLAIRDDGATAIRYRGQSGWRKLEIREAFVHPWLVIIHGHGAEGRMWQRIVLPRDSLSPEEFRKLRAWLRWRYASGGGNQDGDSTVSAGGWLSSGRG
jgi:hypothetical protein